jgi:hypothetical protein
MPSKGTRQQLPAMNQDHHHTVHGIMEAFDFNRVHEVMTALDWQWGMATGPQLAVPSVSDLKAKALELLNQAWQEGDSGTVECSGGFQAWRQDNGMVLQFVVDEAGSTGGHETIRFPASITASKKPAKH